MMTITRKLSMSLRKKMIIAFCLPTIMLFTVNLMLYIGTNKMMGSLNAVYASNNSLNILSDTLDNVQTAMTGYLDTKTSDSLEQYYTYEQDYNNLVNELDDTNAANRNKVMERNIKRMSQNYLQLTNQAVESKRGGNVEKYKSIFEEASRLHGYISNNIYSLNNEQFVNNSKSFGTVMSAMQSLEGINVITLIVIGFGNVVFVVLIASTISEPLIRLSQTANRVSKGDFNVELLPENAQDEIGVVTATFNKMVVSISRKVTLKDGRSGVASSDVFLDEISKRGLTNVTVSQTGCIGMCKFEPLVDVFVPGEDKVTYIKMTPEKAVRVVNDHIVNKNIVSEYTIGKAE